MTSRRLFGFVAFVLACNFLAFQIEPFEEEYDANHPVLPDGPAIASGGLSWESFGKEDAPQPFVPEPGTTFVCLLTLPPFAVFCFLPDTPFQPVRDKSPPVLCLLRNRVER